MLHARPFRRSLPAPLSLSAPSLRPAEGTVVRALPHSSRSLVVLHLVLRRCEGEECGFGRR